MNYRELYNSKLKTPSEAAQVVKSGDWVDFGCYLQQEKLNLRM